MSRIIDNPLIQHAEFQWKKIFLNEVMEAIRTSLERGINPDYLFIDPSLLEPGKLREVCGLKVWVTRLPEDKKIIAVRVHSLRKKANKNDS